MLYGRNKGMDMDVMMGSMYGMPCFEMPKKSASLPVNRAIS